jgi:hypothetical protein
MAGWCACFILFLRSDDDPERIDETESVGDDIAVCFAFAVLAIIWPLWLVIIVCKKLAELDRRF